MKRSSGRAVVKSGLTTGVRLQIDGLSPYTAYSFKIALQNSKGTGPFSTEETATTGEEAPGEVASISVETFATSLKVKWTPPSSPNGRITHYRGGLKHLRHGPVSWACTTGVSSSWVYKDTTGPVQEYTLSTCAYCLYDVKVQAVNGAGVGAEKSVTGILTKASAPTVTPPTLRVTNIKSREVTFTWDAMPCQNRNGASMKYPFRLTTLNGQVKEAGVRDSTTSVTLTGLIPYMTYKFQIAFRNEAGTGPYGTEISVTTEEEVPRAPMIKKAGAELDSISVTVIPPDPPHGRVTKYTIEMWLTRDGKNIASVHDVAASNKTRKFDKLTPITNYTFRAKAWTSKGSGPWSSQISIKTIEGLPDQPSTFGTTEATVNSLRFKWTEPKFPNGVLLNYKLTCTVQSSYLKAVNDNKAKYKAEATQTPDSRETTLTNLQSSTEYLCELHAQTSVGYGQPASTKSYTKPKRSSLPTKLVSALTIKGKSVTTITVQIKKVSEKSLSSGIITAVRIGVKHLISTKARKRRKRATPLTYKEHEQLKDYLTAMKNNHRSYIAAELTPDFDGMLIIGDNGTHGGYLNPPLKVGETYDLLYGIVTSAYGITSVTFSSLDKEIKVSDDSSTISVGAAVGIPIAILIVLAAVIVPVVLFARRRRKKRLDSTYETPMPLQETTPKDEDASVYDELQNLNQGPIYVNVNPPDTTPAVYAEAYATRGAVRNVDYENRVSVAEGAYENPEFVLSEEAMFVGRLVQMINRKDLQKEFNDIPGGDETPKRTFGGKGKLKMPLDIVPYEFNRVKTCSDGQDDVNASFIKANDSKTGYIAAKDPDASLQNQMWEMIWQNQCTAVVMLTTPAEAKRTRCCYWPTKGAKTYGTISVTLIEEESSRGIVSRTFKLVKNEQRQLVLHLQPAEWPPANRETDAILRMLKNVSRRGEGHLLVHCSDGSDRTGTFIALDELLKEGEANGRVCAVDCIKKLRKQRPITMRTYEHYILLHDALVAHFSVGETTIKIADFEEELTKLHGSRMDQLMQALTYFDPPKSSLRCAAANTKVNLNKTRDNSILPADRHRVKLVSKSENGNDFINAVLVQGYSDQQYVVTQMPLPDTVKDFWRLVQDEGITTIVMLNQVDRDDETCAVYWHPKGESLMYEQFGVKCLQANADDPDIIIRDFKVTSVLTKKETMVRQFQLLAWTEDTTVPKKPSFILKLIELADEWHAETNQERILVHCMNGATRSGLFCVAHAALSQMKIEAEVNLFKLARKARASRPQFLQAQGQYDFVYEVVRAALAKG